VDKATTIELTLLSSAANTFFVFSTEVARSLRLIASVALSLMAYDVQGRARKVDVTLPSAIFDFYLHIWNIFYFCYALLPFLK